MAVRGAGFEGGRQGPQPACCSRQPALGEKMFFFNYLDLEHQSPDSGELQYESRD